MLEHTVWITYDSGGQPWHHGSRWKITERVIGSGNQVIVISVISVIVNVSDCIYIK